MLAEMLQPFKILHDPVHGQINLDRVAVAIIDTPEFQRLRQLQQTGVTHLVFPGSRHSRFEHSVGTYHLARRLLCAIEQNCRHGEPVPTKEIQMAVQIAALTHDLGHGPLSHFWERFVHSGEARYRDYKHEVITCHVLDRLISNNPKVAQLLKECNVDTDLVKRLILCEPSDADRIMNNSLNGMDIDKWEYLQRDFTNIGLAENINVERLTHFYRPVLIKPDPISTNRAGEPVDERGTWHLAFRETELENVVKVFNTRKYLFSKFFFHKTVIDIEHMLLDMLNAVEPVMHHREISMNAFLQTDSGCLDKFLRLHDNIIWDIYQNGGHLYPSMCAESTDAMKTAQRIFGCILKRDLYIPITSVTSGLWKMDRTVDAPNLSDVQNGSRNAPSSDRNRSFLTAEQLKEMIEKEIAGKLPAEFEPLLKKYLLVAFRAIDSNSTKRMPQFFLYTRTGEVYSHTEPLQSYATYHIYWRQPKSELSAVDEFKVISQLVRETVLKLKSNGIGKQM